MYPHVLGRLCKPTQQTERKKPKTQIYANKGSMARSRAKIYANKGSMATARKQSLRTGMGRARAGRCRAYAHNGHAQAWRTHAMNLYAPAKGFVDVDCVNVNAAGNLGA